MSDGIIRIRGWRKFQHYGKRRPDWIKLHSDLLDRREYRALTDAQKGLLTALWLLAARLHDDVDTDAELPMDTEYLSQLTGCRFTLDAMQSIESAGFIEIASDALAECKQGAILEREEEESKRERERRECAGFDEFWTKYPKKRGKADARKAWRQTSGVRPALDVILSSVAAWSSHKDWLKDEGQYIPLPATWLRGERWNDEMGARSAPQQPQRTAAEKRELFLSLAAGTMRNMEIDSPGLLEELRELPDHFSIARRFMDATGYTVSGDRA